ncbi:porin [Limnobacter sp.]|uniref:porin n=1 Tax=Limnobacter sp. TaxID=2003368 RepID=UPI0027BA80DB|nr:porin [Limnobacter sp.]
MNKKLVAAALGLAFAAPVFADSSNVTLYGRIHQTLDHQSGETRTGGVTNQAGGSFVVEDASSRLGVRGVEDLGGGLSAIFAYEFGVTTDEVSDNAVNNNIANGPMTTRHAYLGLKGSYGLFVIGSQDGGNDSQAPLYNQASLIGSVSNNGGPLTTVGGGGAIVSNTWAIQRQQRVGNSFGYAGNFGGVQISARHSMQGDNDQSNNTATLVKENDFRATEITATYKVGALTVGGGFANFDQQELNNPLGNGDIERTIQGVASYNFGAFTVAGLVAQNSYEAQNAANGEDSGIEYALSATMPLTANSGLFGMYGSSERYDLNTEARENTQAQIAYYYDFSKRTRTYVGFNRVESEVEASTVGTAGNKTERDNFTIGLRHNF